MKNEKNTQHTPGPWALSPKGNVMAHGGNVIVADCHKGKMGEDRLKDEALANARLIASAPDLLKENEQLKIRVEENEAKLLYFQKMYGRSTQEESYLVQSISALKRLVLSQVALEGIIQQFNDYSESVDEQPNRWFVEACEIAERALAKSNKSEYDQEVKTLEALNAELLEALKLLLSYLDDECIQTAKDTIVKIIAKAEGKTLGVS